jgi:hypothetical protein
MDNWSFEKNSFNDVYYGVEKNFGSLIKWQKKLKLYSLSFDFFVCNYLF